jgi:hypothetical protein
MQELVDVVSVAAVAAVDGDRVDALRLEGSAADEEGLHGAVRFHE